MPVPIICGIIIFIGIIKLTLNKNKVDIVYTWVENDEKFQKEKQ